MSVKTFFSFIVCAIITTLYYIYFYVTRVTFSQDKKMHVIHNAQWAMGGKCEMLNFKCYLGNVYICLGVFLGMVHYIVR